MKAHPYIHSSKCVEPTPIPTMKKLSHACYIATLTFDGIRVGSAKVNVLH